MTEWWPSRPKIPDGDDDGVGRSSTITWIAISSERFDNRHSTKQESQLHYIGSNICCRWSEIKTLIFWDQSLAGRQGSEAPTCDPSMISAVKLDRSIPGIVQWKVDSILLHHYVHSAPCQNWCPSYSPRLTMTEWWLSCTKFLAEHHWHGSSR